MIFPHMILFVGWFCTLPRGQNGWFQIRPSDVSVYCWWILSGQVIEKLIWSLAVRRISFYARMDDNVSIRITSNGSWCMGIKGEMSGTVCVTFTWYMYICELFIAFVVFCCLFIIVTTQFVSLYKPCKPKPKPSTYDPPGQPPPGRDPKTDT